MDRLLAGGLALTMPTTRRMIAGLRQSLMSATSDPSAVAAADVVARWLAHRDSYELRSAHYQEGLTLLNDGLVLLGDAAEDDLRRLADALPARLDSRLRADLLSESAAGLMTMLESTVCAVLTRPAAANVLDDYLARVTRWEHDYFAHLSEPTTEEADRPGGPRLDVKTIQTYLRRKVAGATNVTVISAVSLTGGFGRATVLVTTDAPLYGTRELVIRAELPITILTLQGIDITTEFQVIRLAHRAGIPAPEPLLLEAGPNETQTRFILMRKAPGNNYGSVFGSDQPISNELTTNLVLGLAEIHSIDLTRYPEEVAGSHLQEWVRDQTISQSIRRWIDAWYAYWRSTHVASPSLARAFQWLYANLPEVADPPVLLHSDYALGNLLISEDRVTAVLDWEATHLGDPAEEVAWLVSSLRGKVAESDIVDQYCSFTGRTIDLGRLRYFDVFTAAKMLACGFGAMSKFRDNMQAGPQLCLLASHILGPFSAALETEIEKADSVSQLTDRKR